jgi:predicted RNA-binding protein with PIN domain
MRWILDGYNIILADEKLAKLARVNLVGAREELINEILSAAEFKHENVILVFDGNSGGPAERISPNLQIEFSRTLETADDLIKNMVGNHKKRSTIHVVSNDHSITNFAKECGARVLGSGDFLLLLRKRRNRTEERNLFAEKPTVPNEPDIELLRLFGEKEHEG